ncbi:MAG TPA: alginate O-acetyltransferase AlgF [Pseudomonadales bacterium]|nr:alginate O-acetyltransferase AlgF [Pseudomonadales bacterium]
MLKKHFHVILLLVFTAFSLPSIAKGDALYGPVAPAGSAFVRVVNLSTNAVEAKLENENLHKAAPFTGGKYKFFSPGSKTMTVSGKTFSSQLMADHYYTLVITSTGTAKLVQDFGKPDPSKAVISVYNFSDQPLISLKTADGKTSVIDNVSIDGRGDRSINPVKVKLALVSTTLTPVSEIILERGKVYSLFVTNENDLIVASWIKQADE